MSDIRFRSSMDVELVDAMGTDRSVANAARVSTLGERASNAGSAGDGNLIDWSMADWHGSPFDNT